MEGTLFCTGGGGVCASISSTCPRPACVSEGRGVGREQELLLPREFTPK